MACDRVSILDKPQYVRAHALQALLADRLDPGQRQDATVVLGHLLGALAAEVMPTKYRDSGALTNLGRLRYQQHGVISRQFSTLLNTAWECEAQEWKQSHAYSTSQPALCMNLVFLPGWCFEQALLAYF